MSLAADITSLRDDRLHKLNDLHDDYDHTRKLRRMQQVAVERYAESQTFHNRITGTRMTGNELAALTGASLRRLNEQTFKEIIGQFELFATDLLRLWLTEHIDLVEDKALDIATLFHSSSLEAVRQRALREAVESTVLKKAYSTPEKWFRYIHEILGANIVSAADINGFAEMKATRDLLEHADGIVNSVYLERAGGLARSPAGVRISVDNVYHTNAFNLVRRLIEDTANAAIAAA